MSKLILAAELPDDCSISKADLLEPKGRPTQYWLILYKRIHKDAQFNGHNPHPPTKFGEAASLEGRNQNRTNKTHVSSTLARPVRHLWVAMDEMKQAVYSEHWLPPVHFSLQGY